MAATLEVTDCKTGTASNAPSTGITITKPTNVVNDDVLYAVLCKNSYASSATFTCSGWTEVTSGTRGTTTGNDRHTVVLRKVITNAAGEPANYTFVTTDGTSRNMAGLILRVSGANTTTPEDATVPTIQHTSNDATPPSRDVTTATAGALVIQVHVLSMNSGSAAKTWGAPSDYSTDGTYLQTINTAGALELQVGVAYKTQPNAGAVGTADWTHTSDDSTSESATTVIAVRSAVYDRTVTATAIAAPAAVPAITFWTEPNADRGRILALQSRALAPGVIPTGSNLDTVDERAWAVTTYGMTSSVSATPTPAAIAAPAGMAAPTMSMSATVVATSVAAAAAIEAPTVEATATVVAVAVAAPAAMGAPTLSSTALVELVAVAAPAAIDAPTMSMSATVEAVAVAAVAGLEGTSVVAQGNATVDAVAVAATAGMGTPTLVLDATVVAVVVAATAGLEAITFQAPATASVAAVAASAAVPAPTMALDATVASTGLPAPAGMDAVQAGGSTTVEPASVAAVAGLDTVTFTAPATAPVAAVAALAGLGAPTVGEGRDIAAAAVAAAAGVGAPTVGTTDYFRASVNQAYLGYGQVRLPTNTDDQASRQYHAGLPYLRLGSVLIDAASVAGVAGFGAPTMSVGVTLAVAAIALEAVVPTAVVITITPDSIAVVAGLDAVTILTSSTVVLDDLALVVVIDPHIPFEPTVRIIDGIGCRATVGPHPRPQALRREWGRQRLATDATTPDVLRMGARNGR